MEVEIEPAGMGAHKRPGWSHPRAGAWIETSNEEWIVPVGVVAPRAGAWIETHSLTQSGGYHRLFRSKP